jgi:Undecaprenyl-phosphate glucose phosphotransferase
MLKKQSQVLLTFLFLIDLTIIGVGWNFAYFLRFCWLNRSFDLIVVQIPEAVPVPDYVEYGKATWLIVIIAAICFIYAKMYNPKRVARYKAEFRSIIKANAALYVVLTALTFYYRDFSYSRVQFAYFMLFSVIALAIFRTSVRAVLIQLRKKGRNLRRILIVGERDTAQNFMDKIRRHSALGFVLVGYVSRSAADAIAEPHLGQYRDIPDVIERHEVDQVYIALDSNQQSDLEEINRQLAEQMVDLNIVPDIYHTLNINPELLDLDGMPIIALRQSAVEGWNRVFKRIFDLVGAALLIVVLTPLWIVIPLLIKLTSPGPAFYRQERMGLDGRSFWMIKFRSMRVDAEDETGAVWASAGDQRRTKLGAFLRRTSLDEWPQLFNVLAGTMSLVGPRPERPVFIREFKKKIPNYMLRHKMKAGMTGWAQVNGWRGNTSLEKRIEFDIYYLTHWSIWFDIKILLMTPFTGFVNQNAY